MKLAVIIAAVILLLGGAFGNYLRYIEQTPERPAEFDKIPYESSHYSGEERRFSDESYEILKADTTTLRDYTDSLGWHYYLFIAYFSSQKYGSQIHSPKHCLPGGGWKIVSLEKYSLQLGDGNTRTINRLLISEQDRQQLMFYWYETRGGTIRNEFALKWDLVENSLMLRPTDAAIIRLTVPIGENDTFEAATERGERFLREFDPSITQALPFQPIN